MIKRIIFDIDGTLVTGVNFRPFIEEALRKYGVADYKNKALIYAKNIPQYEEVYNGYDKDLYLKLFSERLGINLDNYFFRLLTEELKGAISPDGEKISKMLRSLHEYELVLLSNFFEEIQRNKLKGMGINNYFNEYYGEKIIKPNEEAYLEAIGPYVPEECVMVGDNKALDIDAAAKLGLNTLWVNPNGDIKSVIEITPTLVRSLERNKN